MGVGADVFRGGGDGGEGGGVGMLTQLGHGLRFHGWMTINYLVHKRRIVEWREVGKSRDLMSR